MTEAVPDPAGFWFDEKRKAFRVSIQMTVAGRRVRKTRLLPKDTTADEAKQIAETMRADLMGEMSNTTLHWKRAVARAKGVRLSWVWSLWYRAKQRSKQKNRAFEITLDDVAALCVLSRGVCSLTGVRFTTTPEAKRMRPFAPSLDRIDSSKGYVPGNCRLVCAAVNLAMFTWGEDAFRQIAIGYVMQRLKSQNTTHTSE